MCVASRTPPQQTTSDKGGGVGSPPFAITVNNPHPTSWRCWSESSGRSGCWRMTAASPSPSRTSSTWPSPGAVGDGTTGAGGGGVGQCSAVVGEVGDNQGYRCAWEHEVGISSPLMPLISPSVPLPPPDDCTHARCEVAFPPPEGPPAPGPTVRGWDPAVARVAVCIANDACALPVRIPLGGDYLLRGGIRP